MDKMPLEGENRHTCSTPTATTPGSYFNYVASRVPSTIADQPEEEATRETTNNNTCRQGSIRNAISHLTHRASRPNMFHNHRDSANTTFTAKPLLSEQQSHQAPLGLAEDGYLDQNPWYGEAARKPVFSLGKPLPHKVRHGARSSNQHTRKQDEETGRLDEDEEKTVEDSHAPRRVSQRRTHSTATARHVQHQQETATAAGVAHNDKRNNAGQPVFDYVPSAADHVGSPDGHSASRTTTSYQHESTRNNDSPPDFRIDGEPLGHQERHEVENGDASPDECRNWWARLRARHPEPLAEFLATGVAVFLGLAGTLSVNLSADQTTRYGNYETSCWAWGFAWMFGIYLGGGVSGAHMNPAISISLSAFRGFPWRQCAMYVGVQFLASLAAGGLAYAIYADSIHHVDPQLQSMSKTFFSTPREWVSLRSAFANQVVGSAIMMIAVLALGDDQNNPPGAGMHALVLGLLVTTLKFTLGYNIGSALNPASDFGPRVVAYAVGYRESNVFQSGWWFYGPWAATVVGSIAGCVIYDSFVFVGSESPVNYRLNKTLKSQMRKLLQRA